MFITADIRTLPQPLHPPTVPPSTPTVPPLNYNDATMALFPESISYKPEIIYWSLPFGGCCIVVLQEQHVAFRNAVVFLVVRNTFFDALNARLLVWPVTRNLREAYNASSVIVVSYCSSEHGGLICRFLACNYFASDQRGEVKHSHCNWQSKLSEQ